MAPTAKRCLRDAILQHHHRPSGDVSRLTGRHLGGEHDVVWVELAVAPRGGGPSALFGKLSALHNGVEFVVDYFVRFDSSADIDQILGTWRFET